MDEFLRYLESPDGAAIYAGLDELWKARADRLNLRLAEEDLPVRVANLSSIWTVCYLSPSRYHWMLQYYLRAEGLALSWVGTGRFIFSLNYTEAEFEAVVERFLAASRKMRDDAWWWTGPGASGKAIKRQVLWEMLSNRFR
jgi:glutamate-1-semialdehyde 2,1-aminomutase